MKRIREFLKTTLLGGLVVILPTAIIFFFFKWILALIQNNVGPLAKKMFPTIDNAYLGTVLASLAILGICFSVGIVVRTQIGKWLHTGLEQTLMKRIPGYMLIKETVAQFLGAQKMPFSTVALVRLFDNDTLITCFVTDEHPDGYCTIFMPTGPNPTSGNIYHVKSEQVQVIAVSVEDTMRSILSCGAGSSKLLDHLHQES